MDSVSPARVGSGVSGRAAERLLASVRLRGGVMRRQDILAQGHNPRTLHALVDAGALVRVKQGLYRLATVAPFGEAALLEATAVVPRGIVCLISALAYYELTTQLPTAVQLAVPLGTNTPTPGEVPIRLVRMTPRFLMRDVRRVRVATGGNFRIFTPERSVCDAFRFRRDVGEDVAYEALRRVLERRETDRAHLVAAAQLTRTQAFILPALKASAT